MGNSYCKKDYSKGAVDDSQNHWNKARKSEEECSYGKFLSFGR